MPPKIEARKQNQEPSRKEIRCSNKKCGEYFVMGKC
jgi:hypothetical protein